MHECGTHLGALERVRCHLGLKATLAIVLVLGFCLPFFLLEYFPLLPVRQLTPHALDRWIGFDDRWVWAYLSLYLYMPAVPLLLVRRSDLRRYATGMMSISAAGFVVFLFCPTAAWRPPAEDCQAAYRWLVGFDRPTNAVPSLHCSFAVFTTLTAMFALRDWLPGRSGRAALWALCVIICISTLVTKQHLIIDAVTGCALGLAGYALVWRNAPHPAPPRPETLVTERHSLYKDPPYKESL